MSCALCEGRINNMTIRCYMSSWRHITLRTVRRVRSGCSADRLRFGTGADRRLSAGKDGVEGV